MAIDQDLSHQRLHRLQQTAIDAAQAAAVPIRDYFNQQDLQVITKNDGSPVTQADRKAESIIRQHLLDNADGDPWDILGEEEGLQGKGTRWQWVIDPIDGTRSFIRGIPLFGTLVALLDTKNQIPLVGVIHLPVLGLTYAAAKGQGAICQGQILRLPSEMDITDTMIGIGDLAQFLASDREKDFYRLHSEFSYVRGYTDCFGHSLVVRGGLGAMMDPALNPWDILATQVLIEEVGGLMICRPSRVPHKVDALFGNKRVVEKIAQELDF